MEIIQKIAKLFVACAFFALCPLILVFVGWLLNLLLQCSAFGCVNFPKSATILGLMYVLSMYTLAFTIPIGIIFFVFKVVTLGLSRKHLIQLILVIFLSPMILGIIVNIIAFMFRHFSLI